MNRLTLYTFTAVVSAFIFCCKGQSDNNTTLYKNDGVRKIDVSPPEGQAIACFAEGCFWCSEHIFEEVVGVDSAVSGYTGGTTTNPTYKQVGTNTTGHAESVLVYYNPAQVSYADLIDVFFASHDPTTPNRQGPDKGSSYRSIAFYSSPEEETLLRNAIARLNRYGAFKNPIVTEVKPLTEFYRAEEYHQEYVHRNPSNGYVRRVSIPRFNVFKKTYAGKLKH